MRQDDKDVVVMRRGVDLGCRRGMREESKQARHPALRVVEGGWARMEGGVGVGVRGGRISRGGGREERGKELAVVGRCPLAQGRPSWMGKGPVFGERESATSPSVRRHQLDARARAPAKWDSRKIPGCRLACDRVAIEE